MLRDERFELIHYQPTTPEVREVPILLVPPMINKFYIMDLAPGRSHIEHLVQSGQEVFAISWRNPRAEQRDWGLDAYADAVIEAFDAVLDISGCDRAHLLGYCAGGLVAAATTSHLAAVGRLEQVASVTLGVCVIDNEHSNVLGAFATEQIMNVAAAASDEEGIPRRARPGERLPLAPPERSHLAVRGQQLAAREGAAGVRHPLLERGHHPHARGAAPGLPRDLDGELDAPARWRHGAGLAGRPRQRSRSTATSWRARWTTSAHGRTATGRRSCSAAARASCCPPAGTSRRSSIRPATSGPPTGPRASRHRRILRNGRSSRPRVREPGGPTGTSGSASARAEMRPAPARLGNRRHKLVGAAPGEYVLET